jgi:predicted Zn-dependent protease
MRKFAISALLGVVLGATLALPSIAESTVQVYRWYYVPTMPSSYKQSEATQQPIYLAQATISDSQLQQAQTILDRLKTANNIPSDISPKIKIENSNVLNAATDGENLIITSGLLSKLNTDDERAFVISHELSHILLQHIAKTQVRRIGLSLLDNFLVRRYTQQGSLLQLASELGIGLVDKRSSRGYELQADDLGVKLMTQAGYNPQAAIQVFDILKANTPSNHTPEFLQDHPISDSRIRALVQKYKLKLE